MPKTRKKPWWAGWRGKSPNQKQRRAMRKRCGKKCFLGPNLSFPICAKGTCRKNKRGIMSAYIRAKQWGKPKSFYKNYWGKPHMKRKVYTRVAKKARKLMGWKKGGRRRRRTRKRRRKRRRTRKKKPQVGGSKCCIYKEGRRPATPKSRARAACCVAGSWQEPQSDSDNNTAGLHRGVLRKRWEKGRYAGETGTPKRERRAAASRADRDAGPAAALARQARHADDKWEIEEEEKGQVGGANKCCKYADESARKHTEKSDEELREFIPDHCCISKDIYDRRVRDRAYKEKGQQIKEEKKARREEREVAWEAQLQDIRVREGGRALERKREALERKIKLKIKSIAKSDQSIEKKQGEIAKLLDSGHADAAATKQRSLKNLEVTRSARVKELAAAQKALVDFDAEHPTVKES